MSRIIVPSFIVIVMLVSLWLIFRPPSYPATPVNPIFSGVGGVTVQEIYSPLCEEDVSWGGLSRVDEISRNASGLVVNIAVKASCGSLQAQAPSATIKDNVIKLGWKWVNVEQRPVAACLCVQHLEFRIPGSFDHIQDLKVDIAKNGF